MAKSQHVDLLLTCNDQAEADKIATALLERQLIACAKFVPITSKFRWKGKIENSRETLLIMESREDLFDAVEAEVAKLHSYDTFVLQAVAFRRISGQAAAWLDKELGTGDN